MTLLAPTAWIVGIGSVAYLLLILAELSRRLGEVVKWPPYYRGLYVGAVLVGFSLIGRALTWPEAVSPDLAVLLQNTSTSVATARILLDRVPLALGATMSAIVAWRYWRWLIWGE